MLVRPQKTIRDCRKPETNAMECERIGKLGQGHVLAAIHLQAFAFFSINWCTLRTNRSFCKTKMQVLDKKFLAFISGFLCSFPYFITCA